ncbi:hypothetical protein F4804DRAFT_309355 [Jackrogersella minutella]|nr:hypothetical protein F4804DRAFT_309355 [Jackrogersella minutella]
MWLFTLPSFPLKIGIILLLLITMSPSSCSSRQIPRQNSSLGLNNHLININTTLLLVHSPVQFRFIRDAPLFG